MDIASLFVKKDMTIRTAIERLDKVGKRILLVVEDDCYLIGVITDGDIRRWILKYGDVEDSLENIMSKSPKFLYLKERDKAISLMKKYRIDAVPILDNKNRVVDLVFFNDMYDDDINNEEISVVIMAGGEGTRLQPYTKIIPKMLIPIGDVPIIERIIDKFLDFKFKSFFISINYKKDIIKAYFNKELNYYIEFLEEEKPLGTAGSLSLLKGKINNSFFLSNCDILVNANYSEMLKFHKSSKNKITVITALKNYEIPYGVFNLNKSGDIVSLNEKPNYEFWVNTGMYIMEPEIITYIRDEEFCHMNDVINRALECGEKVGMYPVTDEAWLDMGEFESMKNMINRLNL